MGLFAPPPWGYDDGMDKNGFSNAQWAFLRVLGIAETVAVPPPPKNPGLSSVQTLPSCIGSPAVPKAELQATAEADQLPGQNQVMTLGQTSPAHGAVPSDAHLGQRGHMIQAMDWGELTHSIHACRACSLGETRQHAVVGAGTPAGPWLFVGEAPGAEEDRRGEAFVGRGGQLLDAMLRAMGLSRQQNVYITNVLKCRPPNNRDPLGPEVKACLPFLQRQIALLQPKVIVALGRFAAQGLLQSQEPLANLRGKPQFYGEIPVIVTYHPAYLLRNPVDKRKAWLDLQLALRTFAQHSSRTAASAVATE